MEPAEVENIKSLLHSGYMEAAQHALEDILRTNPRDLQAWSLYVRSWKTNEKRIKALELCLKYNPGNVEVQRALDSLRSKANAPAQVPKPAAPIPVPPPAAQPLPQDRTDERPAWMRDLNGTGNSPSAKPAYSNTPTVPPSNQPASPRQNESGPSWMAGPIDLNASAASTYSKPERLSNEEIDRQARNAVEDDRKERLKIGRPLAWYDVWYTALTQPNVDAYDSLRLNPYALPSRTYLWLISAGLVSGIFGVLAFGFNPQLSQALKTIEQTGQVSGLSQFFGAFLFCLIPLSGIMYLVSTAIGVGIMHLVATVFGSQGKYSEFLYLVAAYSAPMSIATSVLGIIPFAGACLALPLNFYGIFLLLQAIKSAHNFDTIRAVGVIISVVLLNLIFACVLWLLASSLIVPHIPPQPAY